MLVKVTPIFACDFRFRLQDGEFDVILDRNRANIEQWVPTTGEEYTCDMPKAAVEGFDR